MTEMLQRCPINTSGRDYVVGDIHGCFSELESALSQMAFNKSTDRLFAVGDLIDRGPESDRVIEFLNEPWFFSVRGNHEQLAIDHESMGPALWLENGGKWFFQQPYSRQIEIISRLRDLPLAIQIETEAGAVGVVHADVPGSDWNKLSVTIKRAKSIQTILWSRTRFEFDDETPITGVSHVYVGHSPQRQGPVTLGNVTNLDVGTCYGWSDLVIVPV